MVQKAVKAKQSKDELVKATEVPGFSEHASSGQVLTLAGILGSVYDEITNRSMVLGWPLVHSGFALAQF